MGKNDKFQNQLIIIYVLLGMSLLLGFVNWLTSASSNLTNDLGIWVGSIGTLVAIYFVVRNTNKQIENQNKQMHRPLLRIEDVLDASEMDFEEQTYFQVKSEEVSRNISNSNFPTEEFGILVPIENIGEGIAIGLAFFNPITKAFSGTSYGFSISYTKPISIRKRVDLNTEIKPLSIGKIPIRLYYNLDQDNGSRPLKARDLCNTIAMYSDIHNNIYMLFIQVTLDRFEMDGNESNSITYYQYYSGSRSFTKSISRYGITKRNLIKKYKERFLT